MILLTKLDKSRVLVSLENIKYIESTPDTLVRFVNGDMLIVCESLNEISTLVTNFKVQCLIAANSQSSIASVLSSNSQSGGASSWT